MSRDLNFIQQEKDYWGKVFVEVSYAIDNVAPFLNEKTLKIRKYYGKRDVLKRYIDLLEGAESEVPKSFFSGIFKSNKAEDLLTDYKKDHREDFTQLDNCSKCKCLNCVKECNFNSCLGCKRGSYIKICDKEKLNITKHDNFTIDLTNNSTGITSKYKVIATLQDCKLDRQYIVIENLYDSNEKFILYYYPGISGDDYGEITDGEEFDYIVGAIDSAAL